MVPADGEKTPEEMAQEQVEMYKAERVELERPLLDPAVDPVPWGLEKRQSLRVWDGLIVGTLAGLIVGLGVIGLAIFLRLLW